MTGDIPRRSLLRLTAAVATMGVLAPPRPAFAAPMGNAAPAGGAPSQPAGLPPTTGAPALALADAQTLWARLNGDLSGRTVYYTTTGDVWGFKPQADDLPLDEFARRAYGYAGVAARRLHVRDDGAIVLRQRSWAFYRDPVSERLTERITNLWTGATDTAAPMGGKESEQVLLPVAAAADATDPYHMRVRTIGAQAFVSTHNMIRFKTGGVDWFKLEGNLASHHCLARDLADSRLAHVPNTYTQNLVAEWQTWTHMHGQPGHILFKGDGAPSFAAADIPDELQQAIRNFFPGQLDAVADWG